MSRKPTTPSSLLIHEIAGSDCIEAFRVVRVGARGDPRLSESFESHYETGMAPRYEETQHAAIHMAVSLWREPEPAIAIAREYPKVGGHLARVQLRAGNGFNYLDPLAERSPKHLTVWGAPERLAQAVVDIVPIDPP